MTFPDKTDMLKDPAHNRRNTALAKKSAQNSTNLNVKLIKY